MQQLPHPVYMQQLAHPAYMQQQQQQQWPLPPLWHTNNNNGNWLHNANMAAAQLQPRWQLEANIWNMMQHQLQPQSTSIAMQPQAQRPSQLPYNHAAAIAAAHGNSSHDLMTSTSAPVAAADGVVLQPSQPRDAPTRVANEPLISKEKPQDPKLVNQLAKLIAAAARDQTNASPSTAAVAESASSSKFKPPRTTARPVIPQPEPEQQQQQQQLAPGPQSRSNPPIKLAAKVASSAAAAVALEPMNQLAVDAALAVPVTLTSSKQTSAASTTTGPARRGQGNTCVTRGEQCALEALESLFPGKTFAKVRPDWLINDCTGRAMEIDLYCHELRVGVEHSGKSHYVFPNSLHKNRDEFESQRLRDAKKRALCAREGVLLIEVPFTVPHATMKAYIQSEIERLSDEHEQ